MSAFRFMAIIYVGIQFALIVRLQISTLVLVGFDSLEQCLEVAGTKTLLEDK